MFYTNWKVCVAYNFNTMSKMKNFLSSQPDMYNVKVVIGLYPKRYQKETLFLYKPPTETVV